MLAKHPPLRALGLGIDIDALVGLSHAREMAERTEIGEGVRRYIVRLGEDVGGDWQHGKTSLGGNCSPSLQNRAFAGSA
jgi:hypothetical protein